MKGQFRKWAMMVCLLGMSFLTSCLDVNTSIHLHRNGRLEAKLRYVLMSGTADFGRGFGAEEPWFLPLSEKDFQQRRLQVGGVELKRYRSRIRRSGDESIDVFLEADSLDALSTYLDLPMTVSRGADGGSLTMSFPSEIQQDQFSDELTAVLMPLAGETAFRFRFQPPSRPRAVSAGIIDGRAAELMFTLEEMMEGRAPTEWTVSW